MVEPIWVAEGPHQAHCGATPQDEVSCVPGGQLPLERQLQPIIGLVAIDGPHILLEVLRGILRGVHDRAGLVIRAPSLPRGVIPLADDEVRAQHRIPPEADAEPHPAIRLQLNGRVDVGQRHLHEGLDRPRCRVIFYAEYSRVVVCEVCSRLEGSTGQTGQHEE